MKYIFFLILGLVSCTGGVYECQMDKSENDFLFNTEQKEILFNKNPKIFDIKTEGNISSESNSFSKRYKQSVYVIELTINTKELGSEAITLQLYEGNKLIDSAVDINTTEASEAKDLNFKLITDNKGLKYTIENKGKPFVGLIKKLIIRQIN